MAYELCSLTWRRAWRPTMNRPQQLNAMNRKLQQELYDAVKQADADDAIGCIVITGAGEKRSPGGRHQGAARRRCKHSDKELDRAARPYAHLRNQRQREADARHDERPRLRRGGRAVLVARRSGGAAKRPSSASWRAYGRIQHLDAAQPGRLAGRRSFCSRPRGRAEEAYRIGLLNHLVPRAQATRQDDGIAG